MFAHNQQAKATSIGRILKVTHQGAASGTKSDVYHWLVRSVGFNRLADIFSVAWVFRLSQWSSDAQVHWTRDAPVSTPLVTAIHMSIRTFRSASFVLLKIIAKK